MIWQCVKGASPFVPGVLAISLVASMSGAAPAAGATATGGAAQKWGVAMEKAPEDASRALVRGPSVTLAAWDEGLPIPAGARWNDALGGATSLAPGKNYTLRVYDVDLPTHAVAAFYEHHLQAATRETAGQETRFSAPGGQVKLVPLGHGTRITLVIGPR